MTDRHGLIWIISFSSESSKVIFIAILTGQPEPCKPSVFNEWHSYFLKKCPLTSNCCRNMTFPRYSIIRVSKAKSLAALRIFRCFWTRVTLPSCNWIKTEHYHLRIATAMWSAFTMFSNYWKGTNIFRFYPCVIAWRSENFHFDIDQFLQETCSNW